MMNSTSPISERHAAPHLAPSGSGSPAASAGATRGGGGGHADPARSAPLPRSTPHGRSVAAEAHRIRWREARPFDWFTVAGIRTGAEYPYRLAYTVYEAGDILGWSPERVRDALKRGMLVRCPGHASLILRSSIERVAGPIGRLRGGA